MMTASRLYCSSSAAQALMFARAGAIAPLPCPCDGLAHHNSRHFSAATSTLWRVSRRMVASLIDGASAFWAHPASIAAGACADPPLCGCRFSSRLRAGLPRRKGSGLDTTTQRLAKQPGERSRHRRPKQAKRNRFGYGGSQALSARRGPAGGGCRSLQYTRGHDQPDACSSRRRGA